MVAGRQRNEWAQLSHLLAMLYNAFRPPRSMAASPNDFNPFVRKQAATVSLRDLSKIGLFKPKEENNA